MQEISFPFAQRFDGVSGSAIREIFKMIAQPGMISFAGGNPARDALPDEAVAQAAAQVLRDNGKTILQYGATEGYPPFLDSLEKYVQPLVGTAPNQVLPVTGSGQAMDLLCKALINPGDVILTENPSFLGNLQCMKLYQAKVVPVESDEQGILLDSLEEAIAHINRYGSHHTDGIISEDQTTVRKFFLEVDSAGVYHNVSTRFADGYIYGLGAEVGIATGKLHARGPMGMEGLTTCKYKLLGHGQTMAAVKDGTLPLTHQTLQEDCPL